MRTRIASKATTMTLLALMTQAGCAHTTRRSLSEEGASLLRAPGARISGYTTNAGEERVMDAYALLRSDSLVVYSRVNSFDAIRGTWGDSVNFTQTLPSSEVATLSHRTFSSGKTSLFVLGSVGAVLVVLGASLAIWGY